MRAHMVLVLFIVVAASSSSHALESIDVPSGDFDDGTLGDGEWNVSEGLSVVVEDGNGRLTLAEDWALGRGDLVLPEPPTKQKVEFTAAGLDLSSGNWRLRSVALRVTRAGETFFGIVRAYKQARTDADPKVEIALGKVGDVGAITWTDASTVPIDGTQDLVLSATGSKASLSFGTMEAPELDVAAGDITLCRVEIAGNSCGEARPSIDEISANSN